MPSSLKTRSIKGFVWSAGESFGVAALSFVTFAVMARVLEPRDFGIVALATVFVFFSNLFVAHSFADVVVQREQLEADHLHTAFWSTVGVALALMAACQAIAEHAAQLLGEPALAQVLHLLSLAIPIGALGCVHQALCRRNMRFDALAVRSLAGRAVGAAVGIAMALNGFGLWSLVGQQLVGTLATTLATFTAVAWRPRLRFSWRHLREMWAFGLNVSTSQIVAGAGEQVLKLMIGSLFGSVALGYFTIAWRMVQLVRSLVSSAVYHVGLSAFARLQADRAAMGRAFVQSTRIACLAGFPIAAGIALSGEPLLLALFGAKWNPSVPLLTVLALEMIPIFYGIFFSPLYRAADRSSWSLGMALMYLILGIAGVLIVAPLGMLAVAIFWVARAAALLPVHILLIRRILGLTAYAIAAPVFAPAMATLVMVAGLLPLRMWLATTGLPDYAELALLVAAGAPLYGAAVWLLSPDLAGLAMRVARTVGAPRHETS